MNHNHNNIRILLAALLAATFLMLIGLVYAAPETLGEISQVPSDCGLTVEISGKGNVTLERVTGAKESVDNVGINHAVANCGEVLQLAAVASPQWQFQGWHVAGVEEENHSLDLQLLAPAKLTAVFVPREIRYLPVPEPFLDRSGELTSNMAVYARLRDSAELSSPAAAQADPEIAIWYGSPQPSGLPGLPQKWVDVLGSVTFNGSDPDSRVLRYRLNGGPYQKINYGGNGSAADGRRLYGPGDFVIDLDSADLLPGNNTVLIRATEGSDTATTQVIVDYTPSATWPLPSNVDWDRTGNLLDEAAVVDGQWIITPEGDVRTVVTGYDRTLSVGSMSWTSYEAIVPVTLHGYNSDGFDGIQYAPSLGVVTGWQGHTDDPIVCDQPKCGWLPLGMATWYEYDKPENGKAKFKMWVKHNQKVDDPSGLMLMYDVQYLWKVQVNRSEGTNGTYRLKVWRASDAEPAAWLMEQPGTIDSQAAGSLLLLAHHLDVTFGNVKIRPLNGDFDAPVISNAAANPDQTSATVSWETNELSTGTVEYFSDPDNVNTAVSNDLSTNHELILPNLQPGTNYTVRITAVDASLNESLPTELGFVTDTPSFTLHISTTGYGNVSVSPQKPSYEDGDKVKLTAVPGGPFWLFAGWSGDASGNKNPLLIRITKDTSIVANFSKTENYLPFVILGN